MYVFIDWFVVFFFLSCNKNLIDMLYDFHQWNIFQQGIFNRANDRFSFSMVIMMNLFKEFLIDDDQEKKKQ